MVSMWLHLPPNTPSNMLSDLSGQGGRLCLRNLSTQKYLHHICGREVLWVLSIFYETNHDCYSHAIRRDANLCSISVTAAHQNFNLESALPPIDRSAVPGIPFSLDHITLRYTLWNETVLIRILTTYHTTFLLGPFCSTLNKAKP